MGYRAVVVRVEAYRAGIDNIAILRSQSIGRPAEEVRCFEELAEQECQRINWLADRTESLVSFLPERTQDSQELRETESAVARIKHQASDRRRGVGVRPPRAMQDRRASGVGRLPSTRRCRRIARRGGAAGQAG